MERLYQRLRNYENSMTVAMKDSLRFYLRNRECGVDGKNLVMGLIADQNPPRRPDSHWFRFLNQDTIFFDGGEKLALRCKLPVYFVRMDRLRRGRYQMSFEPIYDGVEQVAEYEITERYVRKLEAMISEASRNSGCGRTAAGNTNVRMSVAKIVILNWNGAEHLRRFLPSVVAAAPAGRGGRGRRQRLDGRFAEGAGDGIPLRRGVASRCRNYGFAGGYNRALEQVRADYYLLLNSDIETPEGWLAPILDVLEREPDVAVVSPKLISWTDRTKFEYAGASGGFIDFLGYPFCRGRILKQVEADEGQYDDARDVFWVSGAAFCCRADVFHALGGFDADFLRPHGGDRPLLAHAAGRLPGAGRAAKQGLPPRRRYAHDRFADQSLLQPPQ